MRKIISIFSLTFILATSCAYGVSAHIETSVEAELIHGIQNVANQTNQVNSSVANLTTTVTLLEQSNANLQSQIALMNNRVFALENGFQKMSETQHSYFTVINNWMNAKVGATGSFVAVCGLITIIMLLIVMLLIPRKDRNKNASSSKDDFNLLESHDGIPSKLNLARAYIDMGNLEGAMSLLHEVINNGDAPQKEEAQKLIESIPVK